MTHISFVITSTMRHISLLSEYKR